MCLGDKGKKNAIIKEFKIIKAKDEELKKAAETFVVDEKLNENRSSLNFNENNSIQFNKDD